MQARLTALSRDIDTIAHDITTMRQMSMHLTQISYAQRTANRYFENLRIYQDKAKLAREKGIGVKTEANSMLNTVQNFITVAAEAQKSAMEMLKKVSLLTV